MSLRCTVLEEVRHAVEQSAGSHTKTSRSGLGSISALSAIHQGPDNLKCDCVHADDAKLAACVTEALPYTCLISGVEGSKFMLHRYTTMTPSDNGEQCQGFTVGCIIAIYSEMKLEVLWSSVVRIV